MNEFSIIICFYCGRRDAKNNMLLKDGKNICKKCIKEEDMDDTILHFM